MNTSSDPNANEDSAPVRPSFLRHMLNYFWRATFLRCPVCGTRPMFLPVRRTRSMHDWFTPLDGCPRCGYPYEREPGYFLMSHWAVGYIVAAVLGSLSYLYLQVYHSDWSLLATLLATMLPLPVVNVLFARHAKAYFLAIDHLADPYIPPSQTDGSSPDDEDDGGGDGGQRRPPPPAPAVPPADTSPPLGDPAGQPGSGIERERARETAGVR